VGATLEETSGGERLLERLTDHPVDGTGKPVRDRRGAAAVIGDDDRYRNLGSSTDP
jgi:hypothetical protein